MNKKIDRELAIKNLREEAHRRVLKNEVMKFRFESANLDRLLKLAKKLNKPAGTLVREWVIEKLDQVDKKRTESPEVKAISIITASLAECGILQNNQIGHIHKLLKEQ